MSLKKLHLHVYNNHASLHTIIDIREPLKNREIDQFSNLDARQDYLRVICEV